jgi:hypothetical protein
MCRVAGNNLLCAVLPDYIRMRRVAGTILILAVLPALLYYMPCCRHYFIISRVAGTIS